MRVKSRAVRALVLTSTRAAAMSRSTRSLFSGFHGVYDFFDVVISLPAIVGLRGRRFWRRRFACFNSEQRAIRRKSQLLGGPRRGQCNVE